MPDRERQVIRAFVALADTLVDDYDVADLLHTMVVECVDLLDITAAGLTLVDERGGLQVLASSTEQARLLELFQLNIDEGPCVDCFTGSAPVLVADIAAQAARWPRFAAEAAREGFASVHALPLRLRKHTIGALNLFGPQPGELSADDVALAQGMADTATIGILHERALRQGEILSEQLQTALNSRVIIEQAKGVLAISGQLGMDAAFAALRGYARRNNRRLSDVARALADHDLDPRLVLAPAKADHRR
ncbi:GAF and ANTAR domain-containing protein [Amycolatopsis sp. WQ 127309]|uniref:GAF and ANTAR domain-containing protein n=1 Tax=Amycolatopsis sp. WQ 127309 TaxID=2932773 RepID=UPI001FF0E8DF|nr:GAF and ANTAR domain-containing protein [Amycolatopsis sp. WQ 127309]UOZ03150.1 GAF and ANTAR domain-containing protein [Amycolatopsis sp. WQ 127309]